MADGLAVIELSLTASMDRMTSLSQNIANANTPSYKSEQSFLKILNQLEPTNSQTLVERSYQFGVGAIQQTGRETDLALYSDGFFLVESGNETFLTRNGQFGLNNSGELSNEQGMTLQGSAGSIRISDEVSVHADGSVWESDQQLDTIQVVLADPNHLESLGGGLYRIENPQLLQPQENPIILQGALEASNVDAQQEMIELVKVMRQIEMQQRFIKAYDQMMDSGITTVGDF